jgi:predicted O-methyltransferase YrrM
MIQDFLGININEPYNIITETELFFLYGLISSINPKTIVELGAGKNGFSTQVFLKGQKNNFGSRLYSIDILDIEKGVESHYPIKKDCGDVTEDDLDNQKIDVVFFDCHTMRPQLKFYNRMVEKNLIDDETILILHDTNLLYEPEISRTIQLNGQIGVFTKDGYAHQWVERNLVNYFKLKGYDVYNLSTKSKNHNVNYTKLFGLSVCQKFKPLTPIDLKYPE